MGNKEQRFFYLFMDPLDFKGNDRTSRLIVKSWGITPSCRALPLTDVAHTSPASIAVLGLHWSTDHHPFSCLHKPLHTARVRGSFDQLLLFRVYF